MNKLRGWVNEIKSAGKLNSEKDFFVASRFLLFIHDAAAFSLNNESIFMLAACL